jgi:hypothetical protein
VYRLDLKLADLDTHSRYLFLSTIAQTNCSAPADKLHSSIHNDLINTMILRESESNNMGRGAYDTTGTPKPPPPPPK